jgi:IS30 family transposase
VARGDYPSDPAYHVSHETIYVRLFIQARGVLKQALQTHLRRSRGVRRPRRASAREPRGHLLDAISIRERPPTVEDRAIPGHWEGDLLAGTRPSHIVTLVERTSRYVLLARLPHGRDTAHVVRVLQRQVRRLPRGLMQTLTWDRGKALSAHRAFTVATAEHAPTHDAGLQDASRRAGRCCCSNRLNSPWLDGSPAALAARCILNLEF